MYNLQFVTCQFINIITKLFYKRTILIRYNLQILSIYIILHFNKEFIISKFPLKILRISLIFH